MYCNGTTSTKSVSYTTTSVVGVYLDMDNGKWYVSVDGTLQNSANLTNGTGFLHSGITGTVHPFILNASSGGTHTGIGNFGQDSTFAGLETATSNSDSNAISATARPFLLPLKRLPSNADPPTRKGYISISKAVSRRVIDWESKERG